MSFDQDFLRGYTQYTEHFDKWCDKAGTLIEEVQQCGIIELNRNGRAFIVANRPDVGEKCLLEKYYLVEPNWFFIDNGVNEFKTHTTKNRYGINFSWFYEREIINADTQRITFFATGLPDVSNTVLFYKSYIDRMLTIFKKEASSILDSQREFAVNMQEQNINFIVENKEKFEFSREKLNMFFQTLGILADKQKITKQEYECYSLYAMAKSTKDISEILNIAQKTVNDHLRSLQLKLGVSTNNELLLKLGTQNFSTKD